MLETQGNLRLGPRHPVHLVAPFMTVPRGITSDLEARDNDLGGVGVENPHDGLLVLLAVLQTGQRVGHEIPIPSRGPYGG